MNRVRMPRVRPGSCFPSLLLALALVSPALAQGTGIQISGDSDRNINVTIDSGIIQDLTIKRPDGKMVIRIPESVAGKFGLDIEPSLRNAGIIQVQDSPQGRLINLNSDRVYLSIQELGGSEPAPPEKKPSALPEKKPPTPRPEKAQVVSPVAPEAPKKPAPALKSVEPPEPEAVTRLLPPQKTPAPALAQAPDSTEAFAPFSLADEADVAAAPGLPEAPAEPLFPAAEEPLFLSEGEDGIPLDLLHRQREAISVASSDTLIRLVLGLTLVLLLAVGFIKTLLPRLMARYPEFFNRLKQQGQAQQAPTSPGEPSEETLAEQTGKTSLLGRFKKQATPPARDSKRAYLEKISLSGILPSAPSDRFEVLSSQVLGKGKELHLVSIKGRQLVVATTPYSVSLIADVTDGEVTAEAPEETHEEMMDAAPQTRAFIEAPRPSGEPKALEQEPAGTPGPEAHHKYLHHEAYRKYLSRPERKPAPAMETDGVPHREQVREQKRRVMQDLSAREQAISRLTADDAIPYVEAEEVVVLSDYDDVYEA